MAANGTELLSWLSRLRNGILKKLRTNEVTTGAVKDADAPSATATSSPQSPPVLKGDWLSNAEFEKILNINVEVSGNPKTMIGLQAKTVAANILNISLNSTRNPLVGQRIYFNVRGVPGNFCGRKSEMEKLTSVFVHILTASSKKTNESNTIIIHGMPGSGKTSLAAALVSSCEDAEALKNFHVLWISAENKRSIRDQFVQACEQYFPGLPLRNNEGKLIKDEDLMSLIYNQLTRNRCLIIFDNAASAINTLGIKEEIDEFFCKSVQSNNRHPIYMITTRSRDPVFWEGYNANMLPLGSFTEEDCWSYMKNRLPLLSNYEVDCRRLWEFFDCLPIAIEHAVTVMAIEASFCADEDDYNPNEFVTMTLEFHPTSLESVHGRDEKLYEKLNCLWNYSLELLRNVPSIGEYAIRVLDVMALLSSTGIPENFLLQILKGYQLTDHESFPAQNEEIEKFVARTTNLLTKFSVVQKTGSLIYVHVLMQDHRRKYLEEASSLDTHVLAVADSMTAAPDLVSFKTSEYAYNFKNIDQICNAVMNTKSDTTKLRVQCARFLQDSMPQTALDLLEATGDTYVTLDIKSMCYANLGNHSQALKTAQILQSLSEVLLESDDPEVLRIKNNMANRYSNLGDFAKALRLSKEVCESRCRVLGPEHPDTLTTKNNMASVYSELGDFTEALKLCKEVCESRCRVLGPEHPHTLSTKNNMASVYSKLGNFTEALRLSKEVCESRCRVLGPEHPHTLSTKCNMATFHSELGDFTEALKLSKEVCDAKCRVLGAEHPDTLSTKSNMANRYSELGDFTEALKLSKEVCDAYCRVIGAEHPDTLTTKNNMASVYSKLGNFTEALRLSKEVCDARCRVLGPEHPDTMSTKSNMATFHSELGDFTEALKLSKEVCEAYRRVLGPEHPDTLITKSKMANRYSELGDFTEALKLSKEVCDAYRRVLGQEHPHTLSTKNNMASVYSKLGNFTEALRLSKEVCDARCRVLGPEHPDTMSTKSNMATFHSELGDFTEALKLSKEVCDAYCRVIGAEHPDTLTTKNNMANVYSKLGNFTEALKLCKEVCDARCRVLGAEHPDTLRSQYNTAVYHYKVGNYAKAIESSMQAYSGLKLKLGDDHSLTKRSKQFYDRICSELRMFSLICKLLNSRD